MDLAMIATIVGGIAAVLTTGAYVPQARKTWKTRSTKDLSVLMLSSLVTGQLLWLAHGIMEGNLPLIGANAVSASLTASILYVKLRAR